VLREGPRERIVVRPRRVTRFCASSALSDADLTNTPHLIKRRSEDIIASVILDCPYKVRKTVVFVPHATF